MASHPVLTLRFFTTSESFIFSFRFSSENFFFSLCTFHLVSYETFFPFPFPPAANYSWHDYHYIIENQATPMSRDNAYLRSRNALPASLAELRNDILFSQIPVLKRYRLSLQEPFNDWRDVAVEWWNRFVDIGYTAKYPALYVFGSTNTGKTCFIKNCIMKDISERQYYSPVQSESEFAWTSWSERVHVVGLVEEFLLASLGQRNRERLKELVGGAGFFAPLKYKNEAMFIKGQIPFIFTSNHSLKEANGYVDPAIASRFLQLDSNGHTYERVVTTEDVYAHLFKEEVISF